MSIRKNLLRTAKSSCITKNCTLLSNKKQPIKECKVNVVRLDLSKDCKQTGSNDAKQNDNIRNKRSLRKVDERSKCSEENSRKSQKSIEKSAPEINDAKQNDNIKNKRLPTKVHEISKCSEGNKVSQRSSEKAATASNSHTRRPIKECKVNLIHLDLNKDCKQTGIDIPKQNDNIRNKRLQSKVYERSKYCEENNRGSQKSIEKSAPALNLRTRRLVKYAESSLEMSKSEEIPKQNVSRVPVYKQHLNDEKLTKRKTDQYEFDSDSEKCKQRKRKKLNNSSLEEYNIAVKKIVNNINKTKKKNKKVIFLDKKECITKQKKAVPSKKQENNNNDTCLTRITSKIPSKKKKVTNEKSGVLSKVVDKENIQSTNKTQEKIVINKDSNKLNKSVQKFPDLLEKDFSIMENKETFIDSNNENDDAYFGFAPVEPVKSPKINVLSDVQLAPRKEWNVSIGSPRLFKDGKPDANSTMLNNVLTPWRFNEINVRRNPHFITLKQSALPCINQEMVLDHTIIDKFNENSTKHLLSEVNKNGVKKTQIQAKIDDFISSNIQNKENDESHLSLFDNEQFSPIKTRTRSSNKNNTVKRKILGEMNNDENECRTSSNQNSNQSISPRSKTVEKKNIDHSNFGFDSLDDNSDKENSPTNGKNDKPFRLSININDKKYYRKKKLNIQKAESVANSDEESDVSELSDMENENGEIRLFEDFNTTKELLEEERVFKKKKKRLYNENMDFQKPKRRKDVRSKEEEEEAEKWAAAFNSMCEEIEEFPLEIE